jgi:hypothetical protein
MEVSVFCDITPLDPLTAFLRNILHPCSRLKSKLSKKLACLTYSSTLRMEVIRSFEALIDFHQTPWHYIPEDRTRHSHSCENLKPNFHSIFTGWCPANLLIYSLFNDHVHSAGYVLLKVSEIGDEENGKGWKEVVVV